MRRVSSGVSGDALALVDLVEGPPVVARGGVDGRSIVRGY